MVFASRMSKSKLEAPARTSRKAKARRQTGVEPPLSKKCKCKCKGKGKGAAVKGAATDNMRLRGLTVEARTHAGPSGLLQKNLSGEADSKSPWETSQGKQGIAYGR